LLPRFSRCFSSSVMAASWTVGIVATTILRREALRKALNEAPG
jgi:hypothetical protein